MTDTALDILDTAESAGPASVELGAFTLTWSDDRPLSVHSEMSPLAGRPGTALVEVFTAREQRERTSQAYYRSAVGARLRVQDAAREESDGAERVMIIQRDETTGLETRTTLTAPKGVDALRVETGVRNTSAEPVVLTAVGSATIGFGRDAADLERMVLLAARSEWLAENRWQTTPLGELLPAIALPLHGQDGRGHAALSSHGAWSSGERVPVGALLDGEHALAWQIESSAGWNVDLCQTAAGGVLTLTGPADLENHFAHLLLPGESFDAVPVAVSVSREGAEGAIAGLTGYRRWLRRRHTGQALPVVYNDFMNTVMGQPTTEVLLPLIREAADAGCEVFCIDAGWFADPDIGDWWATVGEWRESSARFPDGGLRRITQAIRKAGMRVGLWLEPEVVGIRSRAAEALPDDAFFQRFGARVREHDRYHLDFRHPAARAHLDAVVDQLVRDHGVSYLKLDYNINPGAGTEWRAAAPGDGLLGHTRAFRDWLVAVQERHPALDIENCSSGAMRADYGLLAVTHLQSTSDQQDFRLYPPVAASAPASILPEQCGNWAYPAAEMSVEETAFTLVTGLSGRFYLSGFLDRLSEEQRSAVRTAVALHKQHRESLADAVPFWPLGLPAWDSDVVCLGLRASGRTLLFVWDRADTAVDIVLPGITGEVRQTFPASGWAVSRVDGGVRLRTMSGPTARVLTVEERA
ncbi:alpha-galactosidase [Microbacterium barkeri]|uniref:glycoside hydrolase family 36 protein n=1 Tax=Microbacterium barkeri TaxID=33917 RepID=UPI0024AF9464|nr:glycoside hydrolase family 36 protein [Microbacterium barkeri]MDI6943171.1 alpha-galactosidase [Microbacterium barkeri]